MISRRNFVSALGAGLALAGCDRRSIASARSISPATATLYRNGRIWTGVSAAPWIDAMALSGDRIFALGGKALASGAARVIDLQGALVVPGFIDNHTHMTIGALALSQVNLFEVKTRAAFIEAIGAAARKVKPGKWLEGFGWDAERWGGELPTRQWVDGITGDTPISLSRSDGHSKFLNSAALRLVGIDRNTPNPAGGTILRDTKGEATGILRDNALELVGRIVPKPRNAEIDEAVRMAISRALSRGVTQVHGCDLDWSALESFRRLRAAGEPGIRFNSYVPIQDWERMAEIVRSEGRGDDWVRWGGVKAYVDGSLGSRTAYMDAPYADDVHNHGLIRQPREKLQAWIEGADAAGLQVAAHAIGTAANELTLDIFAAAAAKNGTHDRRFRIEHAQHLGARSIPRFKAQGVIASLQPYHAIDDGRWAEGPLGKDRLEGSWAARSLIDAGATVTFGSDWPVAPLDPLTGIEAAVLRRTTDGKHPDGFVPSQKISVAESLSAYTSANAYAGFQEDRLGTIKPGNLADFVVLADDILKIDPARIAKTEVLRTVVGGIERFTSASVQK